MSMSMQMISDKMHFDIIRLSHVDRKKGNLKSGRLYYSFSVYVLRKVGTGTILELSCTKWEFSLCCAIPEW